MISGVLGKTLGFQVTPKERRRDRAGWSWRLTLPLLVLAALNCINVIRVGQTLLIGTNPAGSITLIWAGLNLLGTLIALRACWDPAVQDPAPWFAVNMRATLETSDGNQNECIVTAISESGAELCCKTRLSSAPLSSVPLSSVPISSARLSSGSSNARLQWSREMPSLPVTVIAPSGSRQLVHWAALDQQQKRALLRWLYQRPGCWPERTPPREWLALLVVIKRLLFGPTPPGPFRRSLVPLSVQGDAITNNQPHRLDRSTHTRNITPTLPTPHIRS